MRRTGRFRRKHWSDSAGPTPPWPGLYTQWDGKTLKLLGVAAMPGAGHPHEPGQVISGNQETPVAVATGDGLLGLYRLQLEGRRPVTIREFLAGYPGFVGSYLGN